MRIEDKQFGHIFKKLEPTSERIDAIRTAWYAIDEPSLAEAEVDAHRIAGAWLNSNVRKWAKECDA